MVSINNDYLDTLSQTEDITVTVVGDVMLDRYISGNATRLSAESPVPIVLVESEKEISSFDDIILGFVVLMYIFS